MYQTLVPHPDFPPPCHVSLEARALLQNGGKIRLDFNLAGDLDGIVIPPPVSSGRADELWTTTCFELFLMPAGQSGYLEFNLSPSSKWAAYGFSEYRSDRRDLQMAEAPKIHLSRIAGRLTLTGFISLDAVRPDAGIGMSAVLDHGPAGKSYWAIRHPAGRPDFHHRDCFAARLDAAKAT